MNFYVDQKSRPETAPSPRISIDEQQETRARGKPASQQESIGGRQRAMSVGDTPIYPLDTRYQAYEPAPQYDPTLTPPPTTGTSFIPFPEKHR